MAKLVTVFGGSGFVGRYVVRLLAARGWRVRVAVRDTQRALFLKPAGDLGQVSLMPTSITDRASVDRAVTGADAVVNLVGILSERGPRTFDNLHLEGARNVAEAARALGVTTLVHMSALGADENSASAYARSKALAEAAVRAAFPSATIFRPSVIFGTEDGFFNRFGRIAQLSWILPYFTDIVPHAPGGGGAKFQPVYVGDVAEAMVQAVEGEGHVGVTYELGGPRVYEMREILDIVNRETMRKRGVKGFPYVVGHGMAMVFDGIFWFRDLLAKCVGLRVGLLPDGPLTRDQMKLLKQGSVLSGHKPGLSSFNISPTDVEAVVPAYLKRFRPVQQNKKLRLAAR